MATSSSPRSAGSAISARSSSSSRPATPTLTIPQCSSSSVAPAKSSSASANPCAPSSARPLGRGAGRELEHRARAVELRRGLAVQRHPDRPAGAELEQRRRAGSRRARRRRRSARRRPPRGARRRPASARRPRPASSLGGRRPRSGRGRCPASRARARTERESTVRQLPSACRRRSDARTSRRRWSSGCVSSASGTPSSSSRPSSAAPAALENRSRALLVDGPDPVLRRVDRVAVRDQLVGLAAHLGQPRAQRLALGLEPRPLGLLRVALGLDGAQPREGDRASDHTRTTASTTATITAAMVSLRSTPWWHESCGGPRDDPVGVFLLYRDPDGRRHLFAAPGCARAGHDRPPRELRRRAHLGRPGVARARRAAADGRRWVVCDEGLSHNGTFVNGERVRGRRRLGDGRHRAGRRELARGR